MFSKLFAGISNSQLRVLVVLAFLGALVLSGSQEPSHARLVLRTGADERVFEGTIVSGMTVLDALNASALAGNIPLQFSIDEARDATVIKRLDSQSAAPRIMFYLNDRLIDAAKIHEIPIQPQDTVVVKLL